MPPVAALNARHNWGGFFVNSKKSDGYPRVKLDSAPGWFSTPETTTSEGDPNIGRIGETFSPRTSIGKTLSYVGRIQSDRANGFGGLEARAAAMSASFSDRSSVQSMLVEPWWSTNQWLYQARVMDFNADDEQERGDDAQPSPWQRDFTLNLRMKDGRFYWWNETGVAGAFKSVTHATAAVVENSGTAPTDPIITVTGVGAGQDVHLIRGVPGGTDLNLWFRGLDAGTLIVDFSVQRAFLNDLLTDVTDTYDELSSSWWDSWQFGVPPGIHTISRGPGTGTSIKVDFFSAWW